MIEKKDIEHLVVAHEAIRQALEENDPRKAAKILCKEFKWLVEAKDSFWKHVKDATESLAEYKEKESRILNDIAKFMEEEHLIFSKLKIDASKCDPIIGDVYGALNLTYGLGDGPTPDSLDIIREKLIKATDLICRESKGPIRRGFDWVMSRKGAMFIGGAAIAGSNVAMLTGVVAAPPASPYIAGVSWASLGAGYKVMHGNIEGLIDLFPKPKE
jgi:hypothetical protein